jgi:hypothetical protein
LVNQLGQHLGFAHGPPGLEGLRLLHDQLPSYKAPDGLLDPDLAAVGEIALPGQPRHLLAPDPREEDDAVEGLPVGRLLVEAAQEQPALLVGEDQLPGGFWVSEVQLPGGALEGLAGEVV